MLHRVRALFVPADKHLPVQCRHFLQGCLGQKIGVIRHKENPVFQPAVFIGGFFVHEDFSSVGTVYPCKGPQQRGFACAVGAHQPEHRAGFHLKADAVQRRFGAEPLHQLLYLNHEGFPFLKVSGRISGAVPLPGHIPQSPLPKARSPPRSEPLSSGLPGRFSAGGAGRCLRRR